METTVHLAQELLTSAQCSGGPKSLAEETRALKMRGIVAGHQRLAKTSWERHQNWSRSCLRTQRWHSMVIWHLKQIRTVKKLDKWVPHKLTANQKKNRHFEMSSSHSMQQEWIISWSDCDIWWKVDFLWQQAMTSSLVGLIRNSKALPKATYTPKKMSWSLFGGLLSVWSTSVFWILEKPLHLRSMLCRLMRCTKNCNACSQHRSTERTELQRLTACPTSNASKAQWDEWGLASSTVLTWPLVNWLPLLQASQLFARKMLPQPAWGRKCFPMFHWILRHRFLCYRNKQIYFSLAKLCWL